MTLQEFKAWFDGFTENMSGDRPTEKQWKRIKEKIKAIDGAVTTYPVFIDCYRPYFPRWDTYWTTHAGIGVGMSTTNAAMQASDAPIFNATEALYALGRAESDELTN